MNSKSDRKISNRLKRFVNRVFSRFSSLRIFSDKTSIKLKYHHSFGKKLNLKEPKTFNEKLNWLKLYFRKPIFTQMVDKYEVKQLINNKLGEQYVIPSLGVFDKFEDIDFSSFTFPIVVKTTHESGTVFVIKDKDTYDFEKTKKRINKCLKRNYYYSCREWPYKDCKPRILVETYMKDEKEENLPVYKFFCFDGEPYLVQTIKNDKTRQETIDYFDMNWNLLDLRQNFPNSSEPLSKPSNFEEMKQIAKVLSKGFPCIRVDLYSINGKVYFSEYTFFSDAGYAAFEPEEWDLKLGEMINLDLVKEYGKDC